VVPPRLPAFRRLLLLVVGLVVVGVVVVVVVVVVLVVVVVVVVVVYVEGVEEVEVEVEVEVVVVMVGYRREEEGWGKDGRRWARGGGGRVAQPAVTDTPAVHKAHAPLYIFLLWIRHE
jgi:hypothetical protein